jgi:hypothetical protein
MAIGSSTAATALQLGLPEDSALARRPQDRVGLPVEVDQYIAPGTGGHGRARADALLAVVREFGCQVTVFGYNASRSDKFLIMTGTTPALDALEILLPQLAVQIEQIARAATKVYAKQVRRALPQMGVAAQRRVLVRPYFRDFIRGYGTTVAARLHALRATFMEAAGLDLARVLADHAARVEERFNREFPDRQPLRKERAGHREGLAAGVAAGQKAWLGDQYLAVHDLVFATL